jgi:hypothetical protein
MKRILMPIAAALAALVLPSCFQQNVTITLNKDGSGTIVEETIFGAQMSAMLGGLGGLGGEGADAKDPLKELTSEDKAKERAAQLGEGVTLEKTEPINADGKKGARVTYRFADINKLKYSDPSEAMGKALGDAAPQPEGDKPKTKKPTAFKYADGVLTITNPDEDAAADKDAGKKEDAPAEDAAQLAQAEGMAKAMMADMKISLKLVIAGGIAETNATHVEGDTITLAEMDMGKVLETPGAFGKMKDAGNDSAKAMEALKDVKGVKMEAKKEITVRVK